VSPVCHRRYNTYDAREDLVASRHLAIRDDCTRRSIECPKDSVPAARIPWGSSRRRITALFEAQLIVCHERCGHKPLHETAHVHMEAAWEGDIEGKGCSRLFRSRACGYRRHCQKVRPKLHQHHGRPRPPARHHGRQRTKVTQAGSETSLKEHTGDRTEILEVMRDIAKS
jgi:hypothetical protein